MTGDRMAVRPFYRWYDLWIGMYIDTKKRAVYICVLGFGVKITKEAR